MAPPEGGPGCVELWTLTAHSPSRCSRAQPPTPPRPGLLPLPLPVLGPGVHAQFPCTPALPVQQVGVWAPRRTLPGDPPPPGLAPAQAHPLGPSPGNGGGRQLSPRLPGLACWSRVGSWPAGLDAKGHPPQPAAGKDVFLHRPHHGHHPGRLRPADQPWPGNCSCEAGMEAPPEVGGRRYAGLCWSNRGGS